ncbi:hypothetical protein FRB90_008482 [Tulasnella sp. 427]|nr:hypothetical protein FRB90_008482 [Tulasnella sp. 427]
MFSRFAYDLVAASRTTGRSRTRPPRFSCNPSSFSTNSAGVTTIGGTTTEDSRSARVVAQRRFKKPKRKPSLSGKYKRPNWPIDHLASKAEWFARKEPQHLRLVEALAQARTSFESTLDYILRDVQSPASWILLNGNRNTSSTLTRITRKEIPPPSTSSLQERTAAALRKLLKLGHVSQARQILQMSDQLKIKFSPLELLRIAKAVANVPRPPDAPSTSTSPPPSFPSNPTQETVDAAIKWFLWELRPQLFDAPKRKSCDAAYLRDWACAVEEFMWASFKMGDWTGVLLTFDGTAMNFARTEEGKPSVKMCQLAMQALFARHYYDGTGRGGKAVKNGYSWTRQSEHDHAVLLKKIGAMVEVMRKSGVNRLYPEVHGIVLRELGWLVSSGKNLTSLKLVEDWLMFYKAAMAVRIQPSKRITTAVKPTTTAGPPSRPPTSILITAGEAILNMLEEAKNRTGYRWTKTAQVIVAKQQCEYLERTLRPALDEVMGHLVGASPLGEDTIDQHAKIQSLRIRKHLLHDDLKAAWAVWMELVAEVERAAVVAGKGKSIQRSKPSRPAIPPTTSKRLDSAYARILNSATRLKEVEFICTTALEPSSRILSGQTPSAFSHVWRRSLVTAIGAPTVEADRRRLLNALKTFDEALKSGGAVSRLGGGGHDRNNLVREVFQGGLIKVIRRWWSAADSTAESTQLIGKMFEKFGIELKAPPRKRTIQS